MEGGVEIKLVFSNTHSFLCIYNDFCCFYVIAVNFDNV